MQNAEPHSAEPAHACPLFFVQTPARDGLLHFEPLAHDDAAQHTPSTQLPVVH
jgi:hypothetical protein